MGFFSGLQNAFSPDRIAMTQALMAGDYGAAAAIRARQSTAAAARAEAEQEAQIRADQIWGAKESGYSNPNIATMSAADLSTLQRSRLDPYSQAPGTRRVAPSINGGADTVNTAPTADEQTLAMLNRQDPTGGLARAFVQRQAMPPTPIPEGGGLAGMTDNGLGWLVPPAGTTPTAPTAGGPPPSAPRVGRGGRSGVPRGTRNNSAGNIEDGPFARSQPGYAGSDGRFARFQTPEQGAAAQEALLARNYRGRSIDTIIRGTRQGNGYAPVSAENSEASVRNYVAYIARRTGLDPRSPVPPNRMRDVAAAQREFETGRTVSGGQASAPQRSASGGLPRVSNPAQLAQLPSGAQFIAPDGSVRRKP